MGIKRTHEEFVREIYDLVKNEYIILGEYINSETKILITHVKCGNEYYVKPSNFIHNETRCLKCSGKMKKTTEQFKQEIYNLYQDEYEIIGEYINTHTKIKMKHNKCNNEYHVRPSDLLNNKSHCPKCSKENTSLLFRKTQEQFCKEVNDLVGNEYEVLGKYINGNTKIKMKHNICEFEYEVTPSKFFLNRRCPKCNESKGEKEISNYLNNNNIKYIPQYKFDNCRNKNPLPFDFAIFDNEENLICLIEYDGEFHFENTEARGFLVKYNTINDIIKRDKIKNDYCKENNITLIRIPYFQKSKIEEILDRRLNRLINQK